MHADMTHVTCLTRVSRPNKALASRSPTILVRDPSLNDEAQLAVCEAIASHEFEVLCACAVPCDCGTAAGTRAVKYEASQISVEFLSVLRVRAHVAAVMTPVLIYMCVCTFVCMCVYIYI